MISQKINPGATAGVLLPGNHVIRIVILVVAVIAVLAVFSLALGKAAHVDRWPRARTCRYSSISQVGIGNKSLSIAVVIAVDADKVFIPPRIDQAAI